MAAGPRVAYSVTTVKASRHQASQSSCHLGSQSVRASVCLSLTWEVVHEAGLGGHDPLCPGLAEDGDVALGLLAQSRQAAAEALGRAVGVGVRQPVIVPQYNLRAQVKGGRGRRRGMKKNKGARYVMHSAGLGSLRPFFFQGNLKVNINMIRMFDWVYKGFSKAFHCLNHFLCR